MVLGSRRAHNRPNRKSGASSGKREKQRILQSSPQHKQKIASARRKNKPPLTYAGSGNFSGDRGDDENSMHSQSVCNDSPTQDLMQDHILWSQPPSPINIDQGHVPDSGSDSGSELAPGDEQGWDGYNEDKDIDDVLTMEEAEQRLVQMNAALELAARYDFRNEQITERDRDNLRAINFYVEANLGRRKFDLFRETVVHKMPIDSAWMITHRLGILTSIVPIWYDCCINSCMAFTGKDTTATQCRYCKAHRYKANGDARRRYCYIPIIPRLQGFFQDTEKIKQLRYRHEYKLNEDNIGDVFDGDIYKELCQQHVVVDGRKLPHCYFSGKDDIALGFCTDSYLLFERRRSGPSATPMLLQVYNVPPELRTHLDHLLCNGIIGGPGSPRDARSFCIPYDEELAQLAIGIPTFNALTGQIFDLHAYNILDMGDIIAIQKTLGIKGVNSKSGCRSCEIMGFQNLQDGKYNYYYPLRAPDDHAFAGRSWDAKNLPLRTEETFRAQINEIEAQPTKTARSQLEKHYGINGPPALQRVGSMQRGRSYPWDLMHLLFENVIPNLVMLWDGSFKDLPMGGGNYELEKSVWIEIWSETAQATKTIPSAFVRLLAGSKDKFTAESWCFWFIYLAPGQLYKRLPNIYYQHACNLVVIIKICLKFNVTRTEVDELQLKVITWVQEYEQLYYQYKSHRLCVCVLTVHGMLHIPDDIRNLGPSWVYWTFFMERYCGFLKRGLQSRRFPWANLNKRILMIAFFEQLQVRYDVANLLSAFEKRKKSNHDLSSIEHSYNAYKHTVLIRPYNATNIPALELRQKIANYLRNLIGAGHVKPSEIQQLLPQSMAQWGRLRIVDGDFIRAASTLSNEDDEKRDNTFVRFETEVEQNKRWVQILGYGQLLEILECRLPVDQRLRGFSGKLRLFAVIQPCSTVGRDATVELVTYTQMNQTIIVDLAGVMAVVGRCKSRGKWYIVDRTYGLIKAEFVPHVDDV